MKKQFKNFLTIGAVIGFFVWLYDYDFLLNAGGPETPISNYFYGLIFVNTPNWKATLILMTFIGSVLGVLCFLVFIATRKLHRP